MDFTSLRLFVISFYPKGTEKGEQNGNYDRQKDFDFKFRRAFRP